MVGDGMERKYRIYRLNKWNLVIQRKSRNGKRWLTISYHGNSPSSLASGLFDLIMSQYAPDDVELLEQLKTLELAVISSIEEIRRVTDDWISEKEE